MIVGVLSSSFFCHHSLAYRSLQNRISTLPRAVADCFEVQTNSRVSRLASGTSISGEGKKIGRPKRRVGHESGLPQCPDFSDFLTDGT